MNLKFLRIKLWYTFVIGLLLFNSHFAECQSDRTCDYYFFENNLLPSNFLFINCTAKVANGYLTSSISASNSSNKAIWSITLNKDIQNFSTLNFSYKVGNPKASKKIGFNLSLVINGVPGLNTNGSNRTISYNLDGSSDEWQHATLDISSLIAAWKVVNSNLKYTQVDQINIGIGTTAGSLDYTGDISFDSIFIGNHLKIKSVSLTPSNANQINLIFSRPIGPVTSISGFFISEKGVNNPIVSFQQNTDSSLLFNLTNTLVNSSMGVVSPSLKYSASSLNIHDSLFSEIPILRDDSLTINLNDFLMNTYWPYWGKYDIKNISSLQAQIWKGLDGTIDGWDWSLPPSVKPAPTSLFNIWRTNSLTNSNIANAPTVNFPCNAMLSHWINWKDIEATQGQYKFDALASRIALAKSKGYKSEIRFLFTTQAQVPAWLSSRTDLTFKTGSSYTTTTYDPTNPTYHKFYLAFVDAFAKSGLASNPDVASIYIGYVSPSLGDEGICPVNGDDGDPDPLVITPEEQIGKERLDHWAAATLGYSNKIMMGGDSKYGFGLGFGRRGGFVEHYLYEIPSASIGQIVDKNQYLTIDESAPVIKNNLANGDENEEYENYYLSSYGYTASYPYRFFSSSLRILQMRCNRVLEPLPVVPDLFTYMGNAIGRTVHDTPDAWCWLRENYVLRVGAVKNFEHWLYQRDSIGYTTTPVLKIQHAIDEWMCPWNGEFDNIARCGSKIGFQLDTAFFRVGVHKVAIKISYQDIAGGSLDLVFNDSVQVQQHRTILTTGTNMIKTATFFVAPNFYSSIGKYDFELQSESQVPVVLVRVVKDAPLNVNTEIDQSVDNKKPSISIYPIPVKNILHITSDIEGQIMIINSVGQLVYNSYFKDVNAVDTSSFPSGVYTVFIKGKFEQGKIRFVK